MSESNQGTLAEVLEHADVAQSSLQPPAPRHRPSSPLSDLLTAQQAWLRKRRGTLLVVVCAALVLLALVLTGQATMIEVSAGGHALRVGLASGDTLVAGAGTKLEIHAQQALFRELRLLTGNALFDVRGLGAGQRFVVHTAQADVEARGTVFSVQVTGERTIVRVYEGRVQVAERSLKAGDEWVSRGPALVLERDPLASDGLAAAAQRSPAPTPRTRAPAVVVSALPDVQSVVVDAGAAAGLVARPAEVAQPAAIVAPSPAVVAARAEVVTQRAEVVTQPAEVAPAPAEVAPAPAEVVGVPAEVVGVPAEVVGVPAEVVAAPVAIVAPPAAIDAPSLPPPPANISVDQARSWLLAGEGERALAAALARDRAEQPPWLLLEADALRALRRYGEAVNTYQYVAESAPSCCLSAGYTGASLAFYELQDAVRALGLLDGLALDEAESTFRQPATLLRVDALLWLGRREEAKVAARRYLERERETEASPRLRALVQEGAL